MPYICYTSLASNIAVSVPLPCLDLCRWSWREMDVLRRLFMIVVIIFHITSTNPMPLYSTFLFGRRIIVVQVSSSGTIPSCNVSRSILTKASHLVLSRFFSCVAFLRHIIRCSSHIPEGPPVLPACRLHTAFAIFSSLNGPSVTTSGYTINGMGSPSRYHSL